ncbi:MAG: hypothetical protein ACWIPI_09695 [Polaribacter sp.]
MDLILVIIIIINVEDDYIKIGDKIVCGTHGLFELITKTNPNPNAKMYSEEDFENYKAIMLSTNSFFNDNRKLKSAGSTKY